MKKLEQGRISSYQAQNYIISTIMATSILFVPGISTQIALQDAWISMIIAFLFGLSVAYLSADLGTKYPDKTVIQFSETLLGKIPGKIIGFIYVSYFFYVSYFVQRQFGELMSSVFMINTPMWFFIITLTLLSCYVIINDLEVLVRINNTIVILMIIGISLIIILTAKNIEIGRYLPVFESGMGHIVLGSISPASWFSECTIIMMLIPFISDRQNVRKASVRAIIILFIIMEVIMIGAIGVMGVNFTMRSIFPTFSLVREVETRIDAIFMVIWVSGMLMKLSTFFYAGILGLAQLLNLKEYKFLVFPSAIIITSLSLSSWSNIGELFDFSRNTFTPSIIFVNLVLTLFLYIVSMIRSNKE